MSEITGQDEARRALEELLDEHADASECAATAYLHGAITDQHFAEERMVKARNAILAALRAPSLDRGAEEMRERCAQEAERIFEARFRSAGREIGWPMSIPARTPKAIAAAIRALPVPSDLNEGGRNG